ncbi:MAG: chromate transporter [Reyranella sp.]|nr:MAG: chromate transporter [Reyranella sp.]TBR29390.1 MAG: chromate transporter [Reyranella sp.]
MVEGLPARDCSRRRGPRRRRPGPARGQDAEDRGRLRVRGGHGRCSGLLQGAGAVCIDRGRDHCHLVAPAPRQGCPVKQLWDLAGVFAYLSLLTVGGGMAAFPEMKELTVDTYHWLTFPELLHFYSLGQLAPGPNMMMVASIGAVVGHIPGALVALVAFFLPTGLLTFFVGRLWSHLATWRWRPAIQSGLGSVAVGLVLAGAIIMGRGAITEIFFGVIALVVFLLLWRTKINPAYPIVASGLIGMALHYFNIA